MNLHSQTRHVKNVSFKEVRIAALGLAFTLTAFGAGCGKSSANAPAAGAAAMPVQVRVATSAKIPETTEYLSLLKSRHSAAINPQVEVGRAPRAVRQTKPSCTRASSRLQNARDQLKAPPP